MSSTSESRLGSEHALSPVDAAWFRMESRCNNVDIAAVLVLDGPVDEAELRRILLERLLAHERFRQRVVDTALGLSPPSWTDERDFSLDAHLEHRTLYPPGDDAALGRLLAGLTSAPIDLARSPWRLSIIDGYGTGSVLFMRLHHCMGDGFALVELLMSLAEPEAPVSQGPPSSPVARASTVGHAGPLATALHDARDAAAAVGRLLLMPFDPPTCLRGTPCGERRLAWSPRIPLARVREIAQARSGTVNDVLLAALSGALRRYVLERDDVALSVRAVVPVNLRPPGVAAGHAELGNWFGLAFAELPLDAADRDERLERVEEEMTRLKASKEPMVTLSILAALGRSPIVVDRVVQELFARKATVVVTNVPGPRARLCLGGRTITDTWFWVPHPCGLACGASIMSYAGFVRVGVRSDAAVVPDPERIAELFADEVSSWLG